VVREKLGTLALVILLASSVRAGDIKFHHWPASFVSQEICEIPVVMDVGLVGCRLSGFRIKLRQVGVGAFKGCGSVYVQCTDNVTLSCSIVPTGVVPGTYAASLAESDFNAPGGTTRLCVTLTDAQAGSQGGRRNVRVAVVTVTLSSR